MDHGAVTLVLDLAQTRASTVQQTKKKGEVHAVLQRAASFHCLVEECRDCAELRPKPRKVSLC